MWLCQIFFHWSLTWFFNSFFIQIAMLIIFDKKKSFKWKNSLVDFCILLYIHQYKDILDVLTVSRSQAVKRIVQRDGVKEEDALRRLKSQWPNAKLIEHANVVLCTLWEPDVTQRQVHTLDQQRFDGWCALLTSKHVANWCMCVFPQVLKAWTLLQQRIQKRQEETRSSPWDRFQYEYNQISTFSEFREIV